MKNVCHKLCPWVYWYILPQFHVRGLLAFCLRIFEMKCHSSKSAFQIGHSFQAYNLFPWYATCTYLTLYLYQITSQLSARSDSLNQVRVLCQNLFFTCYQLVDILFLGNCCYWSLSSHFLCLALSGVSAWMHELLPSIV